MKTSPLSPLGIPKRSSTKDLLLLSPLGTPRVASLRGLSAILSGICLGGCGRAWASMPSCLADLCQLARASGRQ